MKRAGQELALLVVDHLLEQPAAHALRHAPVDLALDDDRIDDLAAVVGDDVAQETYGARADVDLHVSDVHRARVGHGRLMMIHGGFEVRRDRRGPREGRERGLDHAAERHARAGRAADGRDAVADLDVLRRRPRARAAAAACSFSRTWRAATWIELPALTALRLANVPTPKGIAAVSPPTTVTHSIGTPSASAATCANEVSCPCPWLAAPVATTACPDASIRTVAPSYGPIAVPST